MVLLDKDNNAIGTSKVAAKWGVAMVTISRIMMAVPSCGKVVCVCVCTCLVWHED